MDDLPLVTLGLSDGMIVYLTQFSMDGPLSFRCQPPSYYESSPIAQQKITALWECGVTLTYFNHDSCKFEQCSLEDVENRTFSLSTFQAVLADLFVDLYEDEHPDEELQKLAVTLGFDHIDRLLSEISRSPQQGYENWRREFLLECGG